MYSGAVDVLGSLTEKLKQQINDTQDKYESFIDATHVYKQGKMNEKEYFAKIGDYLVSTSALDFLAIRVILEIKWAIDKNTLMKNATGGMASSPSSPSSPQAGFGIAGFVGYWWGCWRRRRKICYACTRAARTHIQARRY